MELTAYQEMEILGYEEDNMFLNTIRRNWKKAKFISGRTYSFYCIVLSALEICQMVVAVSAMVKSEYDLAGKIFFSMYGALCFFGSIILFCISYIKWNIFICNKKSEDGPIVVFAISAIILAIYLSLLLFNANEQGCSIYGCISSLVWGTPSYIWLIFNGYFCYNKIGMISKTFGWSDYQKSSNQYNGMSPDDFAA